MKSYLGERQKREINLSFFLSKGIWTIPWKKNSSRVRKLSIFVFPSLVKSNICIRNSTIQLVACTLQSYPRNHFYNNLLYREREKRRNSRNYKLVSRKPSRTKNQKSRGRCSHRYSKITLASEQTRTGTTSVQARRTTRRAENGIPSLNRTTSSTEGGGKGWNAKLARVPKATRLFQSLERDHGRA